MKNDRTKLELGFLIGVIAAAAVAVVLCGGFKNLWQTARFAQFLRVVDSQYVGDYDAGELTDTALAAAAYGLDDWSYYMDAEGFAAYGDYQANRYQGIGVTVAKDTQAGGIRIVQLEKDGPAQKAGLAAGDLILAADGQSAADMDTDGLRSIIQADFDGQVRLTVRHEDGTEEDVDVSCQVVYKAPVSGRLLRGHAGYIAIENFHAGAGQEVLDAIDTLLDQGADCFIFDVRDDPGGQVPELTKVLDRLLPEGTIYRQTDKHGRETAVTSDEACLDMPMAVIVNGDSFSAAELLAATLREYDKAVVVGEPTTGKSRSQVTYELWGGGALHLSHNNYLTPNGVDLYTQGGIVPDVEVGLDEEQTRLYATGWLEPEEDPQVLAALEALGA